MSVTSPSQDVARRLMDDGYAVVTGMMTPDGAARAGVVRWPYANGRYLPFPARRP